MVVAHASWSQDLDAPGVKLHTAMRSKDALEALIIGEAGVNKLNLERQVGTYCLQPYANWMARNAAMLNVGGGAG